jgi:uncharacterized protein with FMN-binding domain
VAPAVILAAAGGLLLYLLPSGADSDTSASEDIGFPEASGAPSAAASAGAGGSAAPAATPAATPAANAKRVIQGDAINFRFGTVQVKIAMQGKTLINIATLAAPGGGYQQYTDRAIPEMKAKILAAQSTRVAAASGATYTSMAYAQSVQSALDKA